MAQKEDLGLFQTQIQTNVSFTSFFSAVVIFFVGLLLSKFETYDLSIKVPITFLIISVFGFLYATLVFANASEEISQKRVEKFKKHMLLGDALSEYLGIYMLVLSMPLAINVITTDTFLRAATISSALIGLAIYQFSHFSVLERHFKQTHYLISTAIIASGIILYLAQIYSYYFIQLATLFIVFIALITYLASKKN